MRTRNNMTLDTHNTIEKCDGQLFDGVHAKVAHIQHVVTS
jgi:hypothetical protein